MRERFDEEELDRDLASDGDGDGVGYDRDDAQDHDESVEFMPMSRRDVDQLYDSALGDMKRFLDERKACDPTRSLAGVAIVGAEIAAGAALSGYLSQRFRVAGAVVPVGLLLGAAGLAASQFEVLGRFSPDLRNVSLGALASAAALWAAGRGIVASEGQTRTGAQLPQPQPQQQQAFAFSTSVPAQRAEERGQSHPYYQQSPYAQPFPAQPIPHPYAPAYAYAPSPQGQPQPVVSAVDFENLVSSRRVH